MLLIRSDNELRIYFLRIFKNFLTNKSKPSSSFAFVYIKQSFWFIENLEFDVGYGEHEHKI